VLLIRSSRWCIFKNISHRISSLKINHLARIAIITRGQMGWHRSIIPVLQEVEIGRILV
jgi:hypothetical protein